MKEGLMDIHKTNYRYFMDNANKYYDQTAMTYAVPIELGETPEGSVDLNREYKYIKVTKKEMLEKIETTADALWSMGIRKGDIVTLCSTNTPELIYMYYALSKIGAISNFVYPNITAEEMKYFIKEVDAKYIFTLDNPQIRSMLLKASEGENVEKIIASTPIESFPTAFKLIAKAKNKGEVYEKDDRIIKWSDFYKLGKKNKGCSKECPYEEYATSAHIHTSGTTSLPQAVMQMSKNANAVVRNYDIEKQDWEAGKKYLQVIPMFVTYGSVTSHIMFCNNVEVIMTPEYNPTSFPGLLKKFHPNYLTVTPAFWDALTKSKVITSEDLVQLEKIGTGGDGFAAVEDRILKFLKDRGCNLIIADGWGLTEVNAVACSNLDTYYKKGTLGKPVGLVEIGVFDPETQEKLGPNEIGELAITGDTVTKGYYNNPEKTKDVYKKHDDGKIWVHSGDLGRMDEQGYFYHEGRIKNIIIRQTFKISPTLEERIIENYPGVKECCIVALPDKNEGQVPSAHITLDDYDNVDEMLSGIIKYCGEKIEQFHMPVAFKIRKDIPKTKNNKNNLNALKIEDLATLIPGVIKSNIIPVYSNEIDYRLEIEVNPDIAEISEDKIEEHVKKFIKNKMIEQKIPMYTIDYNITLNKALFKDQASVKKYSKVKFM